MSEQHTKKLEGLFASRAKPSALKKIMGVEVPSIDELRHRYVIDPDFRAAADLDAWGDAEISKAIH